MIKSDGQTISTEQPESMHVHTGFSRKDETGQTIMVTCPVPYHEHFNGDGDWLSCDEAHRFQGNRSGRVLRNPGYEPQGTGLSVNLPR